MNGIFKPKVLAIGGGTGLSTMLRGLKKYTENITAVVTVADDGGGSGMLRDELKMPPPGIFEIAFWLFRKQNLLWNDSCVIALTRGDCRGRVSVICSLRQ